ncbi:hypothetical protein [Candidatus Lokiarchaeum ossiferum]
MKIQRDRPESDRSDVRIKRDLTRQSNSQTIGGMLITVGFVLIFE